MSDLEDDPEITVDDVNDDESEDYDDVEDVEDVEDVVDKQLPYDTNLDVTASQVEGNDEDEAEDDDESEDEDEDDMEHNKSSFVENPSFQDDDDDEDDDDESDEEDEDYLKKFDKDVVSNYIDIYHPESRMNNYDEIKALTAVIRDETGTIIDDIHKTLPFLTKFEKARILGLRSKQIDDGAQPFLQVPPTVVSGYTIAMLELAVKKIPFIIRRPVPNGGSEYWKLSDLEIIA